LQPPPADPKKRAAVPAASSAAPAPAQPALSTSASSDGGAVDFTDSKYDPITSATWKEGEPVPYHFLARAFEQIDGARRNARARCRSEPHRLPEGLSEYMPSCRRGKRRDEGARLRAGTSKRLEIINILVNALRSVVLVTHIYNTPRNAARSCDGA
jgi:hypothetical protein